MKDAFKAVWTLLKYWQWEAPEGDVGAITLRRMAMLAPYNRWLHERFEGYLGNRILEVGSGVGNQTRYFVDDRERVVASDIEPHYVRELAGRFGDRSNVRIASYRFPLRDEDRDELRSEGIDTIVCMNVLEHIEDDVSTLKDFAQVLPTGGHLVLLVPSLKALYGTLDEHLHHFRRYDRPELQTKVTGAGFAIDEIRFLNRPAVPGWWLSSRVLKRKVMPKGQLRFFKWIMPLLKFEEKHPPGFGLSLLVLARKA
jgi:SAM-dependent methyltransferase